MSEAAVHSTSKSLIYKKMRRSIIMGQRESAERLNIEEIAKEYNTSVTPVRDALQMLSHEGLVVIKPRSGYFVATITLKQLRDLLDIRRILELSAVERASTRITPEQIHELQTVHAGYTGDDDESYDRYTDENRHFHYMLAKASGNNELAELVGKLHDQLARFMVMRRAGKTMEVTHTRIVDALVAHDAGAARQALLEDIDRAHEAILDNIMEEDSESWHL
ncbi:MAG: GntR family transcriptional regulator [Chloroflexi bacterium]|nr:GntR family transcriptional regulator [Chloroflexota bacterium]